MKARKEPTDEEPMVLNLFAINYARDLLYSQNSFCIGHFPIMIETQ